MSFTALVYGQQRVEIASALGSEPGSEPARLRAATYIGSEPGSAAGSEPGSAEGSQLHWQRAGLG